jgi:transposase
MDKSTNFVGIDISKNTFDVWIPGKGHFSITNSTKGFKELLSLINAQDWCVMEATGSYYQQLALFLYKKNIKVSVANPLVIKRFIQMKLQRNKTDKGDAKMIALYASEQPLKLWIPHPEYIEQCKVLNTTIEIYQKQSTSLKNKLHSIQSAGIKKGLVVQSLKKQIKHLKVEIKTLEQCIEDLIKQNEPQMLSNIASIPGIGKKTALLLIANTNAFSEFENHKQVSAYFGLAPTERSSGTSIRGRSRISKRGNPAIRINLFLCSFSACNTNAACKALYNRLIDKGKSKKLALVAVSNKLLKQSFAVAKSGIPFDNEYKFNFVNQ